MWVFEQYQYFQHIRAFHPYDKHTQIDQFVTKDLEIN